MTRNQLLMAAIAIAVIATGAMLYYYQTLKKEEAVLAKEGEVGGLYISSPIFKDGEAIPKKYTRDGEDVSPPLVWGGAPEGTKSYTLIMDDPDAPLRVFTHWVIFNLPAEIDDLPEDVPKQKALENGGAQGMNDFGAIGYGGPSPPRGKPHRYRFHLYALDTLLKLEAGASKQELLDAMEGHVLAEAEIVGIYSR